MNLFLFLIIIILWYIYPKDSYKSIIRYSTWVGICVWLIAGLRSEAIYGDTVNYVIVYNDLMDLNLKEISVYFWKDPVFYIFSSLICKLSKADYTIWLLIISGFYIGPLTHLIKKYSPAPMYAWLCFFFIGIYFFIMAGLRQTMAMGLIISGFMFLMNRREIAFWICMVLAYLFHGAAFIFILAYPIIKYNIRLTPKIFLIYVIILGGMVIGGKTLLLGAIEVISEQDARYIGYGNKLMGSTLTYFIQQLLIVAPSLYILRKDFKKRNCRIFAHLSLIALIAVSLSPVIAEMFRVSMYFSWADIILFSLAMKKVSDPYVRGSFLTLISIYLIFINGSLLQEYLFFFEDPSAYIETHFEFL